MYMYWLFHICLFIQSLSAFNILLEKNCSRSSEYLIVHTMAHKHPSQHEAVTVKPWFKKVERCVSRCVWCENISSCSREGAKRSETEIFVHFLLLPFLLSHQQIAFDILCTHIRPVCPCVCKRIRASRQSSKAFPICSRWLPLILLSPLSSCVPQLPNASSHQDEF